MTKSCAEHGCGPWSRIGPSTVSSGNTWRPTLPRGRPGSRRPRRSCGSPPRPGPAGERVGGPETSSMSGRTFFDTNVLVYLFDADSPAKQARARELFAEQARSGRIVLSPQVLQELYVTVTRKLARPLPSGEALSVLVQLSVFSLVAVDGALILRAVQL